MRTGLGVKRKLFLAFAGFVLMPLGALALIVSDLVSREAEKQAERSIGQLAAQGASFIAYRMEGVKRCIDYLRLDPSIVDLCSSDPEPYRDDVGQWHVDALRLKSLVLSVKQSNADIERIYIYMGAGLAIEYPSDDFRPLSDEAGARWLPEAEAAQSSVTWHPAGSFLLSGSGPTLQAAGRIPDRASLAHTVGYVRADIPETVIASILDQCLYSPESIAFICKADGGTLARSTVRASAPRALAPDEFATLRDSFDAQSENARPGALLSWKAGGRKFLGRVESLDTRGVVGVERGLKLYVAAPEVDVFESREKARNRMLLVALLLAPLAFPFSWWIASASTKRLRGMTATVRLIGSGYACPHLSDSTPDEIGELARTIDGMSSRIEGLLAERYRLGEEAKSAELAALQAQINPHFLYNTLDLVNCMALRSGASEISAAVAELSRFYRLSLGRGAGEVPLSAELDHARSYLRIQNMRFDDSIALVEEIDERALGAILPRIVLQPLVENAILHGIREKKSCSGTITIRAGIDGNHVLVEVEDDGVGADADAVGRALSGDAVAADAAGDQEISGGSGCGIRNVDRRLRVMYGEGAGLAFRHAPAGGAIFSFRLPALRS